MSITFFQGGWSNCFLDFGIECMFNFQFPHIQVCAAPVLTVTLNLEYSIFLNTQKFGKHLLLKMYFIFLNSLKSIVAKSGE